MEAGDIVDIGEGAVVAGQSLGCGRMTGKPEVIPINSTAPLLPADNTLVARVPKDGGVQLRLACRKRDKGRQSGGQ